MFIQFYLENQNWITWVASNPCPRTKLNQAALATWLKHCSHQTTADTAEDGEGSDLITIQMAYSVFTSSTIWQQICQ